MKPRARPTYPLAAIQDAVRAGNYVIRRSAVDGAFALGFDADDIAACVLGLTAHDFYKTMAATDAGAAVQGLWQDVYRPIYEGVALYVKVQQMSSGWAVVISFKEL